MTLTDLGLLIGWREGAGSLHSEDLDVLLMRLSLVNLAFHAVANCPEHPDEDCKEAKYDHDIGWDDPQTSIILVLHRH